jgi:hypothetical protein
VASFNTNRDFYLAIADLVDRRRDSLRSLEEYLRALLSLAATFQTEPGLTLQELFSICSAAFEATPSPVRASWFSVSEDASPSTGYERWYAILVSQIVDLVEMTRLGIINDPERYFGIDAPRGGRWYNLDPCSYIECATEGTLGGWEPGDPTGRSFVPGQVAVAKPDGSFGSANPQDLGGPIVESPTSRGKHLVTFFGQANSMSSLGAPPPNKCLQPTRFARG